MSTEDTEKLRHALKILSDAEKQLRSSNDKWTWLTAALLQLAPDQCYSLPDVSIDPIVDHGQLPSNVTRRDIHHNSPGGEEKGFKVNGSHTHFDNLMKNDFCGRQRDLQNIWWTVLEKIQLNSLKKFLMDEGKLTALSFGFGKQHLVDSNSLVWVFACILVLW